jgi:hypothetical protein
MGLVIGLGTMKEKGKKVKRHFGFEVVKKVVSQTCANLTKPF